MTKKTKKLSNRTEPATEGFDTVTWLRHNARKLQSAIDSVELNGDGEHPATVASLSRLSEALTKVCGELRQHERHALRQLDSYPVEAIVTRLMNLPDDERTKIGRQLLGTDGEESLLQ